MAISLDANRTSSHEFTVEEVGGYAFNEVKCDSDSKVAYKFCITAWFNKFKPEERKLNVSFNSRLYSDKYSSFAQFNVNTKVFVDDVQKASKTITSLNADTSVLGAMWSGDLEYNEDGTLECVVKATLSCTASQYYPPKSATVEIKVKFPNIDKLRNPSLKAEVNGNYEDCVVYARVNGEWVECTAHGYHNNEWKKGV